MPSKHALALIIGLSLAATANAEEYRQHDAHVHGQVEFNIAQDGNDLLVEITAPGADVVGFEHAPENAEQEQALKQALTALKDTGQLFAINPSAKCVIEDVHVSHTLEHDDHEHDDHEGHKHKEHDHDTHHDDHNHDDHAGHEHEEHDHDTHHDDHKHDDHAGHEHEEHDHDTHHDDHENGGHGEFTGQYRFHCDAVSALDRINTAWFKQFPTTESISVNLFTDTTQSSTKLSKENAKITLK